MSPPNIKSHLPTDVAVPSESLALQDDQHSVSCVLPDWLVPGGPVGPGVPTATFNPHGAPVVSPSALTDGAEAEGPAPSTPAAAATVSARLEDEGVIAKGGFGAIHRVYDKNFMRTVAMKVLDMNKAAGHPLAVLRFLEEAQITGQLDHPNIVPVHELGVDEENRRFFTMKLVQGETLSKIFKDQQPDKGGARRLDRLLQIFLKVCDAVSFAHHRGVVHRDLKPDNIMVGSHGQVYVMDWGIAQLMVGTRPSESQADDERVQLSRENKDAEGTIIGTFAYMAPEQALGQNALIDGRTDVFALGAILYQMLTDQAPYTGANAVDKIRAAQKALVKPPAEVAPDRDLPPGLCRIAMKAMKAAPKERYQNVEELKEDIERFLRGGFWFATRVFSPGTVVVREGDDADAAYIITSGNCEAFKMDKGRKTSLRMMGPGDVFGETAIFTSKPRTASVRAVSALTCMVVTRESLEEELGLDSWMGAFVKALAGRFRELDTQHTVARGQLDEGKVITRILETLALSGETRDGHRELAWAPLAQALGAELGKSETDLLAVVGKYPRLRVNRERNVITLKG